MRPNVEWIKSCINFSMLRDNASAGEKIQGHNAEIELKEMLFDFQLVDRWREQWRKLAKKLLIKFREAEKKNLEYEESNKNIEEVEEKVWKNARDLSGKIDALGYGILNIQYYKKYADFKKAQQESKK